MHWMINKSRLWCEIANNAQNFRFCGKWPPFSCQLGQWLCAGMHQQHVARHFHPISFFDLYVRVGFVSYLLCYSFYVLCQMLNGQVSRFTYGAYRPKQDIGTCSMRGMSAWGWGQRVLLYLISTFLSWVADVNRQPSTSSSSESLARDHTALQSVASLLSK
jgi:hypothetical protein